MNPGCVKVQAVWLDSASTDEFGRLLSPDEVTRAGRFRSERDRARFIEARAFLRVLLGRALDVAAEEIRLRYGAHGKPELDEPFAATGLRFNVSHAANLALVALGREVEVGVDVERVRPVPELGTIAANYFGVNERRALEGLPAAPRLEAFHRHWTAKEAWLKAEGLGLAGLDPSSEVVWEDEARGRIENALLPAMLGPWRIHSWSPQPGFVAALAYRGDAVLDLVGASVLAGCGA